METIDEIIRRAKESRASDVHIVRDIPVRIRVDGVLRNLNDQILTAADTEQYARELAGDGLEKIAVIGELDFSRTLAGVRCRMNVFRQQGAFSCAVRLLSDEIPEMESLGLPPVVADFPDYPRGIVLVTGETGSGKSTTLASILNRINHTRRDHIITFEDPIEYIYTPDQCVINQREIGTDTESFSGGLRAALREDPDVMLVGEMRDLATIETALTAAETGHLVFATVHTNSAPDTIDRIVDVFPEARQRQIRVQLSLTLRAVLSQQLLPRREGAGRVAACEVMIVNPAIRNLIREGKTPQIANALLTSALEGSISMDNCLIRMARERLISPETAVAAAHDSVYLRKSISFGGRAET
jgi:twitching motility protein PilT